jgi:hypothetical protein
MADPTPQPVLALWEWISAGFITVLSALIGIIWSRNNEDRKNTEAALKEVASKEELKAVNLVAADAVRHDEYEQNRQEVRQDMQKIHEKLDKVIADVHTSHSTIMLALAQIKNGK